MMLQAQAGTSDKIHVNVELFDHDQISPISRYLKVISSVVFCCTAGWLVGAYRHFQHKQATSCHRSMKYNM